MYSGCCFVFCFKQKTAYEMRMSDWSSDVCSSDLNLPTGIVALCAVAAFLGHVYPVFLGFKGGKGVATALGVILAVNPWLALATVGTWLIVAYVTRYYSLAAIVADRKSRRLTSSH